MLCRENVGLLMTEGHLGTLNKDQNFKVDKKEK